MIDIEEKYDIVILDSGVNREHPSLAGKERQSIENLFNYIVGLLSAEEISQEGAWVRNDKDDSETGCVYCQ